jgi:uncharacterized protein DUF4167
MRQGQQNRRGRGRSNNNNNNNNSSSNSNHGRKPQNPLTRNYESSGPDVKIRGTAAQVAEKYMALARDAASSGDIVMAENYLQHAEHYNRIIMAAQAQAVPQQHGPEHMNGGMNGQHRPHNDGHFAMRDQPQPIIEPQQPAAAAMPPGMEPQPEIVEQPPVAASEPTEGEPAQPPAAADGRRRRRRYPAGGTSRSGGGDTGGGHNGSGNGLDAAAENRPPDDVVAN